MKPTGGKTRWVESWNHIHSDAKGLVPEWTYSSTLCAGVLTSELSVSSVVNPTTNKFFPGSPGEVRSNT
jgi:hypothetical protein